MEENKITAITKEKTDVLKDAYKEQVMLDSDLAMLYQVETKRVNEGVKRNIKRFPKTFCFQLSEEEFLNLKSQIATSSSDGVNGHGEKENCHMSSQNKG